METVCGKIFQHLQPNLHYLTLQIANRLTKLTRLLSWSFSTCLQTSLYFFCFLLRDSVLNSSPHSISSWRQEGPGTISKDHRLSVVGCGWTKRQTSTGIQRHVTCYIDTCAIPWSETRVITLSEKLCPRASAAIYFFKIDFHRPQCKTCFYGNDAWKWSLHLLMRASATKTCQKKIASVRNCRPWHFFQVLCPLSYLLGYFWCDSAARFALHWVFWSLSKYYSLRIS